MTQSPSPAAQDLVCRLPVADPSGSERGWLTFPGGRYARDTTPLADASSLALPSYDWAVRAWLPVPHDLVSPSGAEYVTSVETASGPDLYRVDAKTGTRRLLPVGHGPAKGYDWSLIGYGDQGVYVGALRVVGETPAESPGLWVIDPTTGHYRLIDRTQSWQEISGRLAWTYALGEVGYTVYRLDLASGRVAKWFTSQRFGGIIEPMPNGEVLAWDVDDNQVGRVLLLTKTAKPVPIALPSDFAFDVGGDFKIGYYSQPGVWITFDNGIALFTDALGMRVMAQGLDAAGVLPVGDCR